MMKKFVSLNLQDSMALYLFELRHLLNRYINPYRDFFDKIKFSHRYFDYKTPMHQSDIVETIVYYRIIKMERGDKYKAYKCKKRTV